MVVETDFRPVVMALLQIIIETTVNGHYDIDYPNTFQRSTANSDYSAHLLHHRLIWIITVITINNNNKLVMADNNRLTREFIYDVVTILAL